MSTTRPTSTAKSREPEAVFADVSAKAEPAPAPQGTIRFFRVKFLPRTDQQQPQDVILGVNGEFLRAPRNVETIMPSPFLEAADHATYNQYEQVPGADRKIVNQVCKYPYVVLGEVTRKEYEEFRRGSFKTQRLHDENLARQQAQSSVVSV
jgi:hypothetical protein